ncbi:titin [Anabas testudineus]|uniref:titin n=1 Tax=Anabas testudineus TaxID=64144 RepID=UPI000E455FF9|nr:titin [Anabas testudineus]
MGGAQSAQREDKKDPAAAEEEEEESGKVDDAQPEPHTEDKSLKNNGQISELSGKAAGTIKEVNSHCEEVLAAQAIVSPHEDVPETDMLLKEENLKINENKSPDEADATETVLEIVEMDAKQNDINDSFKRFFSNINLKLTVKRGSAEKDDISADVPDDTTKDEPNRSEGVDDTVKENKSENAEHNTDLNAAQETYDHDSICPTMTDITSEDVLDNAEEKTTEIKEDVCSENAGPKITLPIGEDERVQQNATSEEEAIVSPIKRFFTSGIFSGLRKKKKPAEDEIPEKEMVDVKKEEAAETTDTVQVQEHDKEISLGIEAFTVEKEHKGTGLKEQVQSAASAHTIDEGKSPSTDPSTIIMNESEILSSQEKDKVQASPLKRLLSGSSLKKSAKKQKERKSSDAKMSDSGEHVSNQLLSSSDGADNQKEETPPGEEDGAWASFKKLVTPKKRVKRSSLTNEETQNPSSVQESKSSEGEQISDHSTEESKKRKDSLVSWEAVLCGSGRRRSRSRKTSDSEDEKPQIENDNKKQDSPLESSNEVDESLASYTKQAGNTSEGDGGSTWKSFKKLVTPKKKVKDDNIQSDGEVTQDDSLSSIKKLLPGQKKRRHGEKQDYLSSDEADEEVVSGDEDSETPAVVPLSEFDTTETGVCLQTHADIENHVPKEADYELLQDQEKMAEPVPPCDSLQSEAKQVQEKGDALENETSTTPASNEEPDEITELISKHQQLSDIPEEGIITETMVTPASVTEEPARDDTIAEDLIEMTSEAITAPEPVDITLADETEMISAVSQLSDSSKTSGNTTPVPAEYEIKDTEVLLQQVVENISADPNAVPLFSDEIISEKLVASVSCQILEKFVKQQPTILEMHTVSDATTINTDLNELDTINGLAAKAQMEIVTEVNEAVPTEIAPEASAEFDNAEIAVDEDSITHTEKNLKEVEMINESQDLMECQSEMCDTASIEFLPRSEETVECSLVEADQAEMETLQTDIQEAETKDRSVEQEVQTVLGSVQIPGSKELLSGSILQEEAGTKQHKEEDKTEAFTEVHVDPEKEDELQADVANTDHKQVPQVLDIQAAAIDSEMGCTEISVKEVLISEGISPAETITDEPKGQPEPLTEVNGEPDKEEELEADAAKTEHEQVLVVHEAALDSTETPGKKIPLSQGNLQEEAGTDEFQDETDPLTEVHVETEKVDELQADAANTEHKQVPEVLDIQAAAIDSQMGCTEIPVKEVLISEDSPPEEAVLDEPKEIKEAVTDVVQPEQEYEIQVGDVKPESGQVPELSAVLAAALDSQIDSIQITDEKVQILEDISPAETVTDEPKGQPEPLSEVNGEPDKEDVLQADAANIEHEQVPELLVVHEAALNSTETTGKKIPLSQGISQKEAGTDEFKDETDPLTGEELQADAAKTEHVQACQVLGGVQATALDLERESIQVPKKEVPLSEDKPLAEENKDEPKYQPETLTEVNFEQEMEDELQADANTEHEEVPEELTVQTAALDSQIAGIKIPEKEVPLSEDIPLADAVTEEANGQLPTEVYVMPEKEDELKGDAPKTEYDQVPEALATQAAVLGSIQTPGLKVSLSDKITPAETDTDEPKEETEPLTEVNVEAMEVSKSESVQEPSEVFEAVDLAKLGLTEGSIVSLQKEAISEETRPTETIDTGEPTRETKDSSEPDEEAGEDAKTKTKYVKKSVLPCDAKDIVTKTESVKERSKSGHDKESVERVSAKETDIHNQDSDYVIASVRDEITTEAVAELNQDLEIKKDQTLMSMPQDVQVEQEDRVPEVVDKLQILSAVHVSSVDEESSKHVLEKKVVSEETPVPCVDNAIVIYESKFEVHLSEVQDNVEGEKEAEHPGAEIQTSSVEHAIVGQLMTCNLKEVSAAIPDVLIEKTSEIPEPLIDTAANELEFKGEAEIPKPLMKDPKIQEAVEKLQTISAVHLSPVNEESSKAQVVEKKVIFEETLGPRIDNATITYESKSEVHLNEVQDNVEGEKEAEHPGAEIQTSTVEHAIVGQIMTCNLKEVSAAIPDVLIEKTSEISEPLIDTVAHELEFKEEAEIPTPLMKDPKIQEAVEKLQTISAVNLSPINKESSKAQVLEKKVIFEETLGPRIHNATITYESKSEVHLNEVQDNVEGEKEVEIPGAEIHTSTVEHAIVMQVITCNLKEVSAAIPDVLIEKTSEIPEPLIDTVAHELEFKEEAEIPKPLMKDPKIQEAVEKLQTISAVHLSPVNEESSKAQVLEKKVIFEETLGPRIDNATITYESKSEVHLNEVQDNVEGEKEVEISGAEIHTSTVEHAIVGQLMTCNLKEVSAAIPFVLIEKTSEIPEPLIDTAANELEFKEEAEIPTPLMKDPKIQEAVEKLQTISAVHLSPVNEESSKAQVLEKKVIFEETLGPRIDNATITYESKSEVHLNEVQDNVEGEKEVEISGAEIHTSTVEHAIVGQLMTCNLKEVSAAIPFVLIEKTSEIPEPLIDTAANELEFKEEAEIPTPLMKDPKIQEAVEKLQTISAVHLSPVNEESSKAQVVEKKVIFEETLGPRIDNATITYESKSEVHLNEVQDNVEGEKEVEIPGAEIQTSSVEHAIVGQLMTCNLKEVSAAIPDVLIEKTSEIPEPLIDTVANELELKEEAEIPKPLMKDPKIQEAVEKLQTISAVHLSPVNEESSKAQVLEKKVIFEETLGPRIDNATITYESKSEVHLNEVQDNVEGEKEVEIPGAEIQTSSVEHAIVGQLMTCNLKEVSAAIPDVVIEKTSEIPELLIDTVANELEFKEETEIATPLMRDDVTDTATEHSVVMMMNVPSAAFEDNHRIQVQVVEVDIGSTDIIVDSALEVGVTEAKDIIDVCHETIKVTNKFSATEETEEELITKENKMINHKVIQHVKEIVPEKVAVQTTIQDEAVNLEHILQPDVTELSEMVESKSNQEESQKAMENTSETISQRQDEVLANSDGPASEQLVCDVKQTPNIPGSSSGTVSILYHKDCFKEQKNELKQSEADVTAELLESNKITEEAKIPQSAQSHTVIVKKTGLEVPQNTGIISSIGNLESPSSLSLEFKLNIQFGQAKAPASTPLPTENTDVFPQPATERTEPVKQTNVSDIGVHAVEHQNTINAILETQKKTVLTEVTVQATEIPEPKPENFNSTERSVIINQPVLLDISIQAMEKVQTAEQIKSIERTTPNVQATEKILAVMQTEKSEDFLSRPVLYEACTEEITIEEHVLQIEEENDQDLWVDAEEDIHAPEESDVPIVIVEGPVVHQKESDQEEKARLDRMAPETTPKSKTKEEESQKEMHKMEEIESEEFAVALEHPETATTTATM